MFRYGFRICLIAVLAFVGYSNFPLTASESEFNSPRTSVGENSKYAALAAEVGAQSASCMVVQEGKTIVGEWYWGGRTPQTLSEGFSTMKSVTATLVGIAQTQKKLNIDQKASDFIKEWKGTASESITIRQLLSMTSGRREVFNGNPLADNELLAINIGQETTPGTDWRYTNTTLQVLETVLERAVGGSVKSFAKKNLLTPLGMKSKFSEDGGSNMFMFAFWDTSCRDLAKLVQLYLQNGKWNNKQILSAEFVNDARTSSSALNQNYGLLWWLNREGTTKSTSATSQTRIGPRYQNTPLDMFEAVGACGQSAMGFPTQNLIITFMRTKTLFDALTCGNDSQTNALNKMASRVFVLTK